MYVHASNILHIRGHFLRHRKTHPFIHLHYYLIDNMNDTNNRHHVTQYVGTSWTPKGQTLMGVTRDDNIVDHFGSSTQLSSSGDILLVGARGDSLGPNQKPGGVRAYQFSPGNDRWQQIGSQVTGMANGDQFGGAVSMSSSGQSKCIYTLSLFACW